MYIVLFSCPMISCVLVVEVYFSIVWLFDFFFSFGFLWSILAAPPHSRNWCYDIVCRPNTFFLGLANGFSLISYLVNVYVPKDRVTNLHQGYGFVEFRSEEDADYVSLSSCKGIIYLWFSLAAIPWSIKSVTLLPKLFASCRPLRFWTWSNYTESP